MSEPTLSSEHADLTPAAEPAASRWEDFIDIFYAPSKVFARRANSGFGLPMLVVTILFGVIMLAMFGAMEPIRDAEFQRAAAAAMRNNPNVTAEMMAKGRSFAEVGAKIGTFIIVPIGIFLTGLVLWMVGRLFEARVTLNQAVLIAGFAWMPRVVEAVLNGVQALLLDPASLNGRYRLSLGAGRFFDPDVASPMLLALIGRIDVFTIWVTVLLVIGLSVIGKIPRSRAALAGVLVWVIGAIPAILGAARAS
jgi:Yip1 domain.